MKRIITFCLFLLVLCEFKGQSDIPVYIENGIMKWSNTGEEAVFFGVNYTVPFAYGYRSHKKLGLDLKEAMRQDVYHFSRMGFNAFRVHVWDTEISDTLGNLLNNEHLQLFDYLIFELKKRGIKTLITPIAFWGNGYPEPNTDTPGFSRKFGKGRATIEEEAIQAQEHFLKQFFYHRNPYTGLTYLEDEDIVAMEINNEPSHSGPKPGVTAFVNRMVAAVKSTGWKKPIFYNISQNPWYADAVAASDAEGFAFQWYPSGLVANRTLEGNYLPNADHYRIPFKDTIPAFAGKPLMVYEFDAGDVWGSYIYPMMARSYREAGFQWATQFAYDPMATAYANTEYQTHFVNLAYTPSKAISLMIAGKVFMNTPRSMAFQKYPLDTAFGDFLVSYERDLSMQNSEEEYIYSNTTTAKPLNPGRLKLIAGVGNSPLVSYPGTGAYFLDKIREGVWRLEVMPDAVIINDPYGRAAPEREVSRVIWKAHPIQVNLPDLSPEFWIAKVNVPESNDQDSLAIGGEFTVYPGIYLLSNVKDPKLSAPVSVDFVAPKTHRTEPVVYHMPPPEAPADEALTINAVIAGLDTMDRAFVLLSSGPWNQRVTELKEYSPYHFSAEIPAGRIQSGIFNYRIVANKGDQYWVYPGPVKQNPFDWNFVKHQYFEVSVMPPEAPVVLFNANRDREKLVYYNPRFRDNQIKIISTERSGQLALQFTLKNAVEDNAVAGENYFGDVISSFKSNLQNVTHLAFEAQNCGELAASLVIKLKDNLGNTFISTATLIPDSGIEKNRIPLSAFQPGSGLQLPRPYPGFQDLWQETSDKARMEINQLEKLEMYMESPEEENSVPEFSIINIRQIWLEK